MPDTTFDISATPNEAGWDFKVEGDCQAEAEEKRCSAEQMGDNTIFMYIRDDSRETLSLYIQTRDLEPEGQ
ncbi:MAG: hypothetical protein H9W81_08865 [Enterococcus sp.]|nr:hypothetical protein [Enterococcus sp.]